MVSKQNPRNSCYFRSGNCAEGNNQFSYIFHKGRPGSMTPPESLGESDLSYSQTSITLHSLPPTNLNKSLFPSSVTYYQIPSILLLKSYQFIPFYVISAIFSSLILPHLDQQSSLRQKVQMGRPQEESIQLTGVFHFPTRLTI